MRLPLLNKGLFLGTFWLLITVFQVLLPGSCQGKEIQVQLVWKFKDAGWIQVHAEGGSFQVRGLGDNKRGVIYPQGTLLELTWGGWSPLVKENYGEYRFWSGQEIVWQALGSDSVFRIRTPDGQRVSYRGSLSITWEKTHWRLVNRLDLETYLLGVVPIEMSNQWTVNGMEALKAQAVAARTYAVKKTRDSPLITDSPDRDQAYLGKTGEGAASRAVALTRGEILVDVETARPIDALYSAHNGGYSELAENVWGRGDDHFPSQPDPFSDEIGGAVNRWRFIIGGDYLGKAFDLGPIKGVSLEKFPSGRVKRVWLTDIYGQRKSLSGREFVKAFYPYGRPIERFVLLGNFFDVREIPGPNKDRENLPFGSLKPVLPEQASAAGPRLDRIRSSLQGLRETSSPCVTYIFSGRGWGHGVGMSQWGAYQMAQRNYTYQEILDFYYERVKLVKTD